MTSPESGEKMQMVVVRQAHSLDFPTSGLALLAPYRFYQTIVYARLSSLIII
jgi:hypothetical protein